MTTRAGRFLDSVEAVSGVKVPRKVAQELTSIAQGWAAYRSAPRPTALAKIRMKQADVVLDQIVPALKSAKDRDDLKKVLDQVRKVTTAVDVHGAPTDAGSDYSRLMSVQSAIMNAYSRAR